MIVLTLSYVLTKAMICATPFKQCHAVIYMNCQNDDATYFAESKEISFVVYKYYKKRLRSKEPFLLMFWPDEDTVTCVSNEKVLPIDNHKGGEFVVGETVQVKNGRKTYTGRIAGIGK